VQLDQGLRELAGQAAAWLIVIQGRAGETCGREKGGAREGRRLAGAAPRDQAAGVTVAQ
jgi:hypothetical protein